MGQKTLGVATAIVVLLLAACGSGRPAPQPIPLDALPGEAGGAVRLDASAVAADAIEIAFLEALLDEAGFVGGSERAFGQLEGGRQRALARVLVFDRADGARRYLDWLEEHVDEVIGTARSLEPPDMRGARFLAVHEPSACCPKSTRVYLAAWDDGATVMTLEVGGDGVRPKDVGELAAMLDGAI